MRRFSCLLCFAAASVWAGDPPPPQPGQLANTVTAAPLSIRRKYEVRVRQTWGVRGVTGAAFGASLAQLTNTPGEWGQGTEGYARRFASILGNSLSRHTFAFVVESVTHEDPRYFPSSDASKKARLLNALKQTLICKTDSGKSSFAYGRVIGAFGAGQFSNLWQPDSTNGVGDGIERGFFSLGGDAAWNLIQEFVPRFRPKELR